MHRQFRDALNDAEGHSEYIAAVIGDIRGFSSFSIRQESPEVATYIKRVYIRLIDDYFPSASFWKSTGDGLLMTFRYSNKDVQDVINSIVKACIRSHREFANICEGDPMVNFDVPTGIGFGIARGTACRLVSGEHVLDYSGDLLNLTSRLTDLARPSGVVIDGRIGFDLLEEDVQSLFREDNVYLRSVAEDVSRTVYVQHRVVEVPDEARRRLTKEEWVTETETYTHRQWRTRAPTWTIDLPTPLKRPGALQVIVEHDLYHCGRLVKGAVNTFRLEKAIYKEEAGQPQVDIDVNELLRHLAKDKIPNNREVQLEVSYVPE